VEAKLLVAKKLDSWWVGHASAIYPLRDHKQRFEALHLHPDHEQNLVKSLELDSRRSDQTLNWESLTFALTLVFSPSVQIPLGPYGRTLSQVNNLTQDMCLSME